MWASMFCKCNKQHVVFHPHLLSMATTEFLSLQNNKMFYLFYLTMIIIQIYNLFYSMILVLHQHSHHHHHGHASKQCGPTMAGVTREVESVGGTTNELNPNVRIKKHSNINVRAAFIHVIGDLFQSIGVVIAAYIIRFKVQYHVP